MKNPQQRSETDVRKLIREIEATRTREKSAELALRKSEERFLVTLQHVPITVFQQDKDLRYTWIHNLQVDLKPEEIIGKQDEDFVPPDHAARLREIKSGVLRTGKGVNTEVTVTVMGMKYSYTIFVNPLHDQQGTVIGITGVTWDITERKKAEEELRLNDLRLQYLVDLHKLIDAPQKQVFGFVNEAITNSLQSPFAFVGFVDESEETMTIHTWSKAAMEQCSVDDKPLTYHFREAGLWAQCVRQRKPVVVNSYPDLTTDRKGLPEGHVEITRFLAIPVFDGDHIVAVAGAANKPTDYADSDITAFSVLMNTTWEMIRRKQTEERLRQMNEMLEDHVAERTAELLKANAALQKAEEKYRTISDFTYDWEYWINNEGSYNYVSPSCERITGYTAQDFIDDKDLIYKIIHPDDLANFTHHVQHQFTNKEPCETVFRIRTRDGAERWIGHACQPVWGMNGEFLGKRGSNRDITEKVKAENELLNVTIEVEERERNRFSRELHDGLGPLLSTIKLYFQWLAETKDRKKIKMITEKGNINIERAFESTREVAHGLSSQFLTEQGYVRSIMNFTELINDTEKLHIDFSSNTDRRFSNILEITLYRITTELINNTLTHGKATKVKIGLEYNEEKKCINFTFQDNGTGFDMAELERKGGGFGLRNIRQRIKVIRGTFTIRTGIGKGVKVGIVLPVSENVT